MKIPLPGTRALVSLETVAGTALAVWLQIVGLVTGQVLHHVLHALPVLLLVSLPRNRWVRLTSVMTGFVWIFMLAVITPMVYQSLLEGGLWRQARVSVWLAPVAALLSAIWAAASLTLLAEKQMLLPIFAGGLIAFIPALACLHPHVHQWFEVPLAWVLAGRVAGAFMLVGELVAVLAAAWISVILATGRRDLWPSRRILAWQALFWAFFLTCMIVGLLPAVNP